MISEIAHLNLGSRPASRRKSTAIEDLRAIPWVFSWAQCRLMLPAGMASAARCATSSRRIRMASVLRRMYREWPFSAPLLLSNMDMVLAQE